MHAWHCNGCVNLFLFCHLIQEERVTLYKMSRCSPFAFVWTRLSGITLRFRCIAKMRLWRPCDGQPPSPSLSFYLRGRWAGSGHSPQYCLSSSGQTHLDQFSPSHLLRRLSQRQLLLFRRRRLQLEADGGSHPLLEKTPVASQDVQAQLLVVRWLTDVSGW